MEQSRLTDAELNAAALIAFGAPSTENPDDNPVAIGPVISGRDEAGKPAYYVDLLYADGRVERRFWAKPEGKYDRAAKNAAYYARTELANKLRDNGVVLCHDTHSFRGMVLVLGRMRGSKDGQGPGN